MPFIQKCSWIKCNLYSLESSLAKIAVVLASNTLLSVVLSVAIACARTQPASATILQHRMPKPEKPSSGVAFPLVKGTRSSTAAGTVGNGAVKLLVSSLLPHSVFVCQRLSSVCPAAHQPVKTKSVLSQRVC